MSVQNRQSLLSTDLMVWVGSGLEQFLVKPMAQREGRVLTSMEVPGLEWPTNIRDPHLWLNPQNNLHIIDALLVQLQQIAPEHSEYYASNARAIKNALQQQDQRILALLKPLSDQYFIVDHPAYHHFVHRYGLQQLAYVSLTPERRAGAKHLFLLRQQQKARCVFKDYGMPSQQAKQLAAHLDVPLLTLDPLGAGLEPLVNTSESGFRLVLLIEQLAEAFLHCLAKKTL